MDYISDGWRDSFGEGWMDMVGVEMDIVLCQQGEITNISTTRYSGGRKCYPLLFLFH